MIPLLWFTQSFGKINRQSIKTFAGIGFLLGLHWLCFYGSIKLANASVAMICLSTISIMTVFFEAIFNKQKLVKQDLLIGFLVIPGILMINQSLNPDFKLGFWVGILCAVFSAMVAPLNKKYLHQSNSLIITWLEITVVAFLFTIFTAIEYLWNPELVHWPSSQDWVYLLILCIFCTVIPLTLALASLRHLSAFSIMLVFNLETVYGIILSIVILKEHHQLNILFYCGVLLILASVFAYPYIKTKVNVT